MQISLHVDFQTCILDTSSHFTKMALQGERVDTGGIYMGGTPIYIKVVIP